MLALTSPVRTRAHDWPAGPKLAALCGSCIFLFAVPTLPVQVVALTLTACLAASPGSRFARSVLGSVLPLWPFVAILLVWNWIDGTPRNGLILSLRLVTAVTLATLVTMTTRIADIMEALGRATRLLRRLGLSTRPLEFATALVLRFTPSLLGHARQLSQSWRARSPRRPNWRIIGPLAILALDEAEHVADALRARGGLEGQDTDGT